MSKHVQTGTPRKTIGAYLKVVKALNELEALGEDIDFHPWEDSLFGVTGKITRNHKAGEWRLDVEAS